MQQDDLLLAFDVGTTAVKGAVYSLDGKCLLIENIAYEKHFSEPGWVEQDPSDWVNCLSSIIEKAKQTLDLDKLVGIGVTSQVNTHVFVDASGKALMNAIVWEDQRCAEVTNTLNAAQADGAPPLDTSSLICRAEWVRLFRTKVWQKTHCIMSPKDYCIQRLTGEFVTDGLTSIGLVDEHSEYLASSLAMVEGLEQLLPPIKPIDEVIGYVQEGWGIKEGCPVVTGTMDAWAGLFGSAAFNTGQAFEISGTSEILGLISNEVFPSTGVVSFPPFRGRYLHGGPTQAGGDALKWFARSQRKSIEEILLSAAEVDLPADPLIFLPHLMGERAPLWDTKARGAFIGLTKNHGQGSMARAVMEGVGFSARHLLKHIERAAGYPCNAIIISGGGSRSDLWCQIKANIMNRTIKRVENVDTGTFGAALMAASGIGLYQDLEEATKDVVIDRCFEPDEKSLERYDALYQVYRESYERLGPIYEAIYQMMRQ